MEPVSYQLLVIDAVARALLIVDGINGEIISEVNYPAKFTPIGLAVTCDYTKAYIPVITNKQEGAILQYNIASRQLFTLPVNLPQPVQFAAAADGSLIYLADIHGTLHVINTVTLEVVCWGQTTSAACVGLAALPAGLLAAWEQSDGGTIAEFSSDGKLVWEQSITGIPTNIDVTRSELALIPFTTPSGYGEGIILLNRNSVTEPVVLTTLCQTCASNFKIYPCHTALASDDNTIYVVNEDIGCISIIDISALKITGYIQIGRSISSLYILPDERFAIAASNVFADLCLIDLVNKRLMSTTSTKRELLSSMAVIPV